jgi:large subunit ribosomal protein L9
MRVILLSDQRHLGTRGQEVDVKPGFARNFLLPRGLALEATAGNRRIFEQQRAKIDAAHASQRDAAQQVAARLASVRLEIPKRVGEAGTLYGSVTATEVAERLAALGFEVDRRRIDLEGGIKSIGDHPVRIDLHSEVEAEITVTVVPEA